MKVSLYNENNIMNKLINIITIVVIVLIIVVFILKFTFLLNNFILKFNLSYL